MYICPVCKMEFGAGRSHREAWRHLTLSHRGYHKLEYQDEGPKLKYS